MYVVQIIATLKTSILRGRYEQNQNVKVMQKI